jgi:hypothetical protein
MAWRRCCYRRLRDLGRGDVSRIALAISATTYVSLPCNRRDRQIFDDDLKAPTRGRPAANHAAGRLLRENHTYRPLKVNFQKSVLNFGRTPRYDAVNCHDCVLAHMLWTLRWANGVLS